MRGVRTRRGVAPALAALIALAVGVGGGIGLVALAESTTGGMARVGYCPFETGSGIEFPTPGYTGNVSPNATIYANGSVVFTAIASACTPPYTFQWVFGDGATSTAQNVVHVYSGPGYYPGSVTIRDSAGHGAVNYFCVNAIDWPNLTGGTGSSPPPCPN